MKCSECVLKNFNYTKFTEGFKDLRELTLYFFNFKTLHEQLKAITQ